jgi:hypothetical protein
VWSYIAARVGTSPGIRVVAAVRSEALARVLGYLLIEADELESFVGVPSSVALSTEISRLAPDVIVVTRSSLGNQPAARITQLKASHPASRLLVIASSLRGDEENPVGDADAQILEEAVVARLVSEIRKLARGVGACRPVTRCDATGRRRRYSR